MPIRIPVEELFGGTTNGVVPDVDFLSNLIRSKLPPARINELHVGIALAVTEPCGVARLNALLAAFEDISQIPILVHLFVLGPEAFIKFNGDMAQLVEMLRMPSCHKVHCRDICWVRTGSEAVTMEPGTITKSRLRAATNAFFLSDPQAHHYYAILRAGETPYRDSISCRLFFDRSRWEAYASAELTGRLARTATTPGCQDVAERGAGWVHQAVYPVFTLPPPTAERGDERIRRPSTLLEPSEVQDWNEPVSGLRGQADRILQAECLALESRLQLVAETDLPEALSKVAGGAPNALQSLADAAAWATGVQAEVNSPELSPPKKALLPTWLSATNDLLGAVFGLDPGAWGFDLKDSRKWPERLSRLRGEMARLSIGEGDTPMRRCAGSWIGELLPRLIAGQDPEDDPVKIILHPVTEILSQLGEQLDSLFQEAQEERRVIEAQHPAPESMFGRTLHRLFGLPKLRKALSAWDRKHLEKAGVVYQGIDSILNITKGWLALAVRHKTVAVSERSMRTKINAVLLPVLTLGNQFAKVVINSISTLEQTPSAAPSATDLLSLPDRRQMGIMVAGIDPDVSGWINQSRGSLPEDRRGEWMHVARACLSILPAWATGRARSLAVDLGNFLTERFPETLAPVVERLAKMGSEFLLPLKRQNAERRRIHQEWHLPSPGSLSGHRIFDECLVEDEIVSTAPTSCVRLTSPDRDWLELHLHILGFRPEDYIHWRPSAEAETHEPRNPPDLRTFPDAQS